MRRILIALVVAAVTALASATTASADTSVAARLDTPPDGGWVDGVVVVRGTAASPSGETGGRRFQFYKLEVAGDPSQREYVLLGSLHDQPVVDGVLGVWDVRCLAYGAYRLRLTTVDQTSDYREAEVTVATRSPLTRTTPCPTSPGGWLRNTTPTGLWSGPNGDAVLFNTLPAGAGYFKVSGPSRLGRVPVYYPGDRRGGLAGPAWIDLVAVQPSGPPPELPLAGT